MLARDDTQAAITLSDDQAAALIASAPAPIALGQQVARRHVLYLPGYGPMGVEQRRRLFGLEFRRFLKVWRCRGRVSPGVADNAPVPSVSWTATTATGDARIEVEYETLCWDELVARDFGVSPLIRAAKTTLFLLQALSSGILLRVARVAPWGALVWLYPLMVIFAMAVLALLPAAGALVLIEEETFLFLSLLVWVAAFVALVNLLDRMGAGFDHFSAYTLWFRRYVARDDAVLEERLDAFADRLRQVVGTSGADEVLVVGHSTGSFLAIDVVARAYEADPEIGRAGPAISLLTVGAMEVHAGLHSNAGWLRDRIARVAMEPTLFWAEAVGPWDVLNFSQRDPVEELGLPLPANRPNPTFRRIYVTKMLSADTITRIRRRWDMFRLHQQFVMSNEVQGPYDYYALVCGPWLMRSQFERTRKGASMSPHLGKPQRPSKAAAA